MNENYEYDLLGVSKEERYENGKKGRYGIFTDPAIIQQEQRAKALYEFDNLPEDLKILTYLKIPINTKTVAAFKQGVYDAAILQGKQNKQIEEDKKMAEFIQKEFGVSSQENTRVRNPDGYQNHTKVSLQPADMLTEAAQKSAQQQNKTNTQNIMNNTNKNNTQGVKLQLTDNFMGEYVGNKYDPKFQRTSGFFKIIDGPNALPNTDYMTKISSRNNTQYNLTKGEMYPLCAKTFKSKTDGKVIVYTTLKI